MRRLTRDIRFGLGRKRFSSSPPVEGLDVIVVSPGGVATTALMEHISRFARINSFNDADMLKHLPYPPREIPEGLHFLFIHGDPDAVYRSIRRRGWVGIQSLKLGSILAHVLPHPLSEPFFKSAVRAQLRRWRRFAEGPGKGRTLFVEYSRIWESKQEIAELCAISDPTFVSAFPEKKPRTSPGHPATRADTADSVRQGIR